MRKYALELVAIIASFAIFAAVLAQGKEGGEIVYEEGQPFKAAKILSTLKEANEAAEDEEECDAKLELYEDSIDTIEEISQEVDEALGIEHKEEEDEDEE